MRRDMNTHHIILERSTRTTKVIYLLMDEDAHLLTMLYLGDTREDPRHRFDRMEW